MTNNPPPCGRPYEGLAAPPDDPSASPVARWLAGAAYLEDASVTSFEILARELAAHRAPSHLVIAARRAARDEVRHARVMAALAQRHGARTRRAGVPSHAATASRAPRALAAILRENAVEGCVNETYGALIAWHQTAHAEDPKVRAAMARIAADETTHASLAWRLAAWGEQRLDDHDRAEVASARECALAALRASLIDPPTTAATALGLPSATVARAMLERLGNELFTA